MKNQPEKHDHCPNQLEIIIIGINHETREALAFHPACKQWDCPYCAERNKEGWVYRGLKGAVLLVDEGLTLEFVTITSRPYTTANSSRYFFSQNWPKLARRAKYHTEKKSGQKWAYFLIPEQHKTGRLHAHLIAATHLCERWWKDNAYKCGLGYIANVQEVEHPAFTVAYVTKYLAKSIEYTEWPKGFRRVRTSRNWPAVDKLELPGWIWSEHNDDSADWSLHALREYGYRVVDKRRE
jgi:hypothetical protein